MDFTSATGFKGHVTFYDPDYYPSYNARTQIDWSGTANMGSYVFQPTDYIALRYSGGGDYPAIDCIFTGAFATSQYFDQPSGGVNNAGYRWALGTFEGKTSA